MFDLVWMYQKRFFAIDSVDFLVISLEWHFQHIVGVQLERSQYAIDLELLEQSGSVSGMRSL